MATECEQQSPLCTWTGIQDFFGIRSRDEVEPVTVRQHGRFYVCEWVVHDQSLPDRSGRAPEDRDDDLGFRVVRSSIK